MRPRSRKRWPVGTYAELRDPKWLAAHMSQKKLDCADMARRCTHEQAKPVSRQMISKLKNGRSLSCSPTLAVAICGVLDLPIDTLFALQNVRNQNAKNTQRGAA